MEKNIYGVRYSNSTYLGESYRLNVNSTPLSVNGVVAWDHLGDFIKVFHKTLRADDRAVELSSNGLRSDEKEILEDLVSSHNKSLK